MPRAVERIRDGLEASVTFKDRRLLGVSAQMVLPLLGAGRAPADFGERTRLLGAIDALSQATGTTVLQTLLQSSLAGLRE